MFVEVVEKKIYSFLLMISHSLFKPVVIAALCWDQ